MNSPRGAALVSIIAHARSGALDWADRLFHESGLDEVNDDPAVLSVKGRLLKDHALAASGWKRKTLYREAAEAYARAAEIGGASYPLINAATLSMLAGQQRQAQVLARRVLAQIDHEAGETPYWRAATRAEAQLLLGRIEQAKASLQGAISLAPGAFEDHASTLRQLGLILEELDAGRTWLDGFRPPRSLHFAGHMSVSPARSALESEIRKTIEAERIGYGYGALAAGADIVIAEALLEAGAELHLVLPAATSAFRDVSVASLGGNWTRRFDAIIEQADSVRIIGNRSDTFSALEITLAAEIAMGNAVMQAEFLMTEAVQLLILDRKSGHLSAETASGASAQVWKKSGRRQYVLTASRTRARTRLAARKRPSKRERLAALLRIEISGTSGDDLSPHVLPRLAEIFHSAGPQLVRPRWTGEAVTAAIENPAEAAQIALSIAGSLKPFKHFRIAAHYGIARLADDPFTATQFVAGCAASVPNQILLSTPLSAIHASEDFAAVLCAGAAAGRPRVEYIGDMPAKNGENSIRLFSLKR
ncbi:MAG TPA: tetratricopeptide repeat-containing protein [Rhizomicrobium sp.]|nr:tetratricopeptide repeat-containing protein [Rhizomicrobium sp.]